MKVLHCISNNSQVHYFDLFAELNRDAPEQVDLHFLFLCKDDPLAKNELAIKAGATVHWLRYRGNRKKELLPMYYKVKKLLQELTPDVVHTNLFEDALVIQRAAAKLKIAKRIHTKQCTGFHWNYAKKAVRFDRMINKWATDLIAVSRECEAFLLEKELAPKEKVTMIHHGISFDNLSTETPEARKEVNSRFGLEGKRVIGSVSRYIHWKRYTDLIEAFELLLKKYDDLIFLGVGAGPQQKELEKIIESKGLQGRFILTGWVEKRLIPAIFQSMEVYVHAAYMEPFGFVFPEAAANNLPLVSTPTGAALDLIDEHTGRLAEYNNPASIAREVSYLLDHPDIAKNMGIQANKKAREMYDVKRMWSDYVKLYQA